MNRLTAILCMALLLAAQHAARAQDADWFDPTQGPLELYRFNSIPPNAEIEYNGEVYGLTEDQFQVQEGFLPTIRLVMDGYLPCTYTQGTTGKAKMGLTGIGTMFFCRLEVDPSRPGEAAEGPASWIEFDAGPNGPG